MTHRLMKPSTDKEIEAAQLTYLIEDFLESARLTPLTRRTYSDHLRPFLAWWTECAHVHQNLLSPTILDSAFQWFRNSYLTSRGTPPAENTVAHCAIVLHRVFAWLNEQGCTDGLPIQKWIPQIRLVQPDVYYPTTAELQVFWNLLESSESPWRLRDMAICAFALSTGARASEIVYADIAAIEWAQSDKNDLRLSSDHRGHIYLSRVKGDAEGRKGKVRYAVFCSKAGLLLKIWLLVSCREQGSIFNFQHGKAIYQMMSRHLARNTSPLLSETVAPQVLRRAFSDHWDDQLGIAERAQLKFQLGHSMTNDVTQSHYINTRNKKRIAKQLLDVHVSPLDDIEIDWSRVPFCEK